mgnify:CR=1 FL=1
MLPGTHAPTSGPRPLPGEPDALYRNTGNGRFTDVTQRLVGLRAPPAVSEVDDARRPGGENTALVEGGQLLSGTARLMRRAARSSRASARVGELP